MRQRDVEPEGCLSSGFSMEPEDPSHLCFPHLPNISCGKSSSKGLEGVLFGVLLPVECVATVLLNLLVIVSISHFRHKFLFFLSRSGV